MLTVESRETATATADRDMGRGPARFADRLEDAAVLSLDLDGHVTRWNSGAERTFGPVPAGISVRDRSFLFTAAEVAAGRPRRALQTALAKGHCQIAGWRGRANGPRFWAEIMISALRDDSQRVVGFLALVHDMTERKRRVDRLRAALDISQAILGGIPPEQVLQLIVRRARALLQSDGAQVTMRTPGSDELLISVAEGWNARVLMGTNLRPSRSLIGLTGESGRSHAVEDVARVPGDSRSARGPMRLGPTLAVPLAGKSRRFGTLAVYNRVGGPPFRPQDLGDLRLLASHAVLAMHHAAGRRDWRQLVVEEQARIWHVFQNGAIQSLDQVARGLAVATGHCRDHALREQLSSCVATVEGVIQDVRNHVLGLPPGILDGRRLDDALILLARDLEMRTGLATIVEMEAEAAERLAAQAGDVVQLVREALSNVGRHAHARRCRLNLHVDHGRACLEIEDDGVGFAASQLPAPGHGLSSLRERVTRLGGQLQIDSAPQAGTTLRIAIPV
jgi:PAS domain S-box-containing protein